MLIVKRNYLILLILALIFILPGISAYFVFNHPVWLGRTHTNKGELINPPVQLTDVNSRHKWRLISWQPNACGTTCFQTLDMLGRIRLSLGRRLYDVELWLIIANQQDEIADDVRKKLYNNDIHFLMLSQQQQQLPLLTKKPQIFIANPEDYLVLAYTLSAKPEYIYHDLHHLLN